MQTTLVKDNGLHASFIYLPDTNLHLNYLSTILAVFLLHKSIYRSVCLVSTTFILSINILRNLATAKIVILKTKVLCY